MALDFSPLTNTPNWMGLVAAGMEARQKVDARDAFGQLVTNPQDASALARLAQADPELAYKYSAQTRKEALEAQTRVVAQRAVQGDAGARDQLAGLDPDLWAKLDTSARSRIKQQTETVGQLALWADTPEKWQQALGQARALGVDVSRYQDFGTREAVLAEAGLVKEHLDRLEPKWVTPGEGGAFNARDPRSLEAWSRSQGAPAASAQPTAPTADEAGLAAMARAAIAAGADPAAVRARMQQLRGGAPSQGGATFP